MARKCGWPLCGKKLPRSNYHLRYCPNGKCARQMKLEREREKYLRDSHFRLKKKKYARRRWFTVEKPLQKRINRSFPSMS
jgi:hypothetical protein